jgi:hypothetical protein
MAGRGDDEQLVVAHVLYDQVRRQVRGLDEAEPRLSGADQLEHAGGVGDGELDDGRRVVCRLPGAGLLNTGLLNTAEFDEPMRDQVLGDRLAGRDGKPVRHPGPDRAQARLQPVGGVEHVFRPADHQPALLGEVRP